MWKKVSMFDVDMVERNEKRVEDVYYRLVDWLEVDEDGMWNEGDVDWLEDMKREDWIEEIEKNDEEIEVLERVLEEVKKVREWNRSMMEKDGKY